MKIPYLSVKYSKWMAFLKKLFEEPTIQYGIGIGIGFLLSARFWVNAMRLTQKTENFYKKIKGNNTKLDDQNLLKLDDQNILDVSYWEMAQQKFLEQE